jgi:hypothetical protein
MSWEAVRGRLGEASLPQCFRLAIHLVQLKNRCKVKYLTKQEQIVLCLILVLVLMGWAVKCYRMSLRSVPAAVSVNS